MASAAGNSSTPAHHSASRTVASPFPLFEPQAPTAQENSPADSQVGSEHPACVRLNMFHAGPVLQIIQRAQQEDTRFSPEVLDIGRCLAMLQKVPNDGSLSKVMALDHAKRLKLDAPFDPLRRSSPPAAGAGGHDSRRTQKIAIIITIIWPL